MNAASLRISHTYISAFITPMVLFFALSGTLQIFSLHEAHGGYVPPAFLAAIGRLHKDQALALPAKHSRPAHTGTEGAPAGAGAPDAGPPMNHSERKPIAVYALKWLFALEAVGLVATTLFGVVIGLTHAKRKRTTLILLIVGTVLPAILVAI